MRPHRRLASLVLAATAALALAACSSTVDPTVDAAPMAQQVAVAADTGAAHTTPHRTPTSTPTSPPPTPATAPTPSPTPSTDDSSPGTDSSDESGYQSGTEDLPEPGDGVQGDEGLCEAVAGWYGYATLALVGAGADGGHVFPDDVVPLLEQLRDAPTAHEDADPDLVDRASDLSYATDDVITEITSGADAAQAMGGLDDPANAFLDACIAAGISV
jgi:hypothetical protein